MTNKIDLGDKVKDSVTGFTGIAIARTTWLHGCDRICVQPAIGKDGKHPENMTFDELQLTIIKKGAVKQKIQDEPKIKLANKVGGPRDDKGALRRN